MPNCPRCGMWSVKRAPRRGLREYVLSLLTIGPYRCQFCSHRFLVFFRQVSFTPGREHARIPALCPVFFRPAFTRSDIAAAEGALLDLSIGGCTIETRVPITKGACLSLQFQLSDREPLVQIDTALVQSSNGHRIGLEFVNQRPEEADDVRRFMTSLLNRRPSV